MYWQVTGGDGKPNPIEWDDLLERGKEMPDLLELSVLTNYAKENVGTIWTIMESLWNILVANISLFVSALTALISLLFGGKYNLLTINDLFMIYDIISAFEYYNSVPIV